MLPEIGEQLTMDYSTLTNTPSHFECWCGTSQCRHRVKPDEYKEKWFQDRYGSHNPRTKILLGTPSASTTILNTPNTNATRSLRISSADLLDDLREQLEIEKTNYETRKRRAVDVENRPISVPILEEISSPLPSSTYDFLSNRTNYNLGVSMSDADYNDLFNSDPINDEIIRTTDETQLAINSIVDCGVIEQHENPIDISDSTNFFFDDLDIDNHHQDNNQSQDDEASRAVQNLLGFS
ncbi:unnamed protein product [Rotaria sp. Silwood1]|nr:unnamed protein product [Rotaria sp. Silwood1]